MEIDKIIALYKVPNHSNLQSNSLRSRVQQNSFYQNYNVNRSLKKQLPEIPQEVQNQLIYGETSENDRGFQLSRYNTPEKLQKIDEDTNVSTPRSQIDFTIEKHDEEVKVQEHSQLNKNKYIIYIQKSTIQNHIKQANIHVENSIEGRKFISRRSARPVVGFLTQNHQIFQISIKIKDMIINQQGMKQSNKQQNKIINHIGIGIQVIENISGDSSKFIIFTNQGQIIQYCKQRKYKKRIQSEVKRKFTISDRVILRFNAALEKLELLIHKHGRYLEWDERNLERIQVFRYCSELFKERSLKWQPFITMEQGCHTVVVENLRILNK